MAQASVQPSGVPHAAAPPKASSTGYSRARGPKLWDSEREGLAKPGSSLLYDGPSLSMAPNEGAWLPVRLKKALCYAAMISQCIIVPIAGTVEVTTGFWDINDTEGMVFGCNLDVEDHRLINGNPIAAVEPAVAQERTCMSCGTVDVDALSLIHI